MAGNLENCSNFLRGHSAHIRSENVKSEKPRKRSEKLRKSEKPKKRSEKLRKDLFLGYLGDEFKV